MGRYNKKDNTFWREYRKKFRTADEAVKVVKSGDWVDYTVALGFPPALDRALAKRRDELFDVKLRGNLILGPIQVVECDPSREHFFYNSWHCSNYERQLCDKDLCNYIPMSFRNVVPYYRTFLDVNVAMMSVAPMDNHGYFNLSCSTGVGRGILEKADIVIVEVNENLPRILGGFGESIHISEVDYVVEGDHNRLPQMSVQTPSEEDIKIAEHIMPEIRNGSTLQLGIGAMPSVIGKMLSDSDIKELGMHTELASDAYFDLYEAGKLTNRKKNIFAGKSVTGVTIGTDKLYDWVDDNPGVAACPLEWVNNPYTIAQIDDMISINSCISIDLYGQVSAEAAGLRHISGTGGQLDFLMGASMSVGGKAFVCMKSSFVDGKGVRHSNVKPFYNGDIVTDPRSQDHFIVTEYGIINMAGRSTWERTEMLINIAHPDFRDELVKAAEKQKIWKKTSRMR